MCRCEKFLKLTVEIARAEGASIHEFAIENALDNISQVGGFRKLIGRLGRDMISAGDPHQIAGLLDTLEHNVRRILNGLDTIPEMTAKYRSRHFDEVGN